MLACMLKYQTRSKNVSAENDVIVSEWCKRVVYCKYLVGTRYELLEMSFQSVCGFVSPMSMSGMLPVNDCHIVR